MRIEHIALWTDDIEAMREFYMSYFDTVCGGKYVNPGKNYTSYFISFNGDETRLELMYRPDILDCGNERGMRKGYAHISVSVGTKEDVNKLTERMRNDRCNIISEPRTTGDGYYESVVADPEGNYIELLGE